MNTNLLVGILVLVVGAVLLYLGYSASQGIGEQVRETFTGRFSEATTWYIVGGMAATIAGIVFIVLGARS